MHRNDFDTKPSVEAKPALTEPSTEATLTSSNVTPTDTDLPAAQQPDTTTSTTTSTSTASKTIIENIKVKKNE